MRQSLQRDERKKEKGVSDWDEYFEVKIEQKILFSENLTFEWPEFVRTFFLKRQTLPEDENYYYKEEHEKGVLWR